MARQSSSADSSSPSREAHNRLMQEPGKKQRSGSASRIDDFCEGRAALPDELDQTHGDPVGRIEQAGRS